MLSGFLEPLQEDLRVQELLQSVGWFAFTPQRSQKPTWLRRVSKIASLTSSVHHGVQGSLRQQEPVTFRPEWEPAALRSFLIISNLQALLKVGGEDTTVTMDTQFPPEPHETFGAAGSFRCRSSPTESNSLVISCDHYKVNHWPPAQWNLMTKHIFFDQLLLVSVHVFLNGFDKQPSYKKRPIASEIFEDATKSFSSLEAPPMTATVKVSMTQLTAGVHKPKKYI